MPHIAVATMRLVWLLALLTSHADGACNYVKPNEGLLKGSTCDSLWETNNLTCSYRNTRPPWRRASSRRNHGACALVIARTVARRPASASGGSLRCLSRQRSATRTRSVSSNTIMATSIPVLNLSLYPKRPYSASISSLQPSSLQPKQVPGSKQRGHRRQLVDARSGAGNLFLCERIKEQTTISCG